MSTTDLYMLTNHAAVLPSAKHHPFPIKSSLVTHPAGTQILVHTRAIAINPIDYKLQSFAIYPVTYPTILGQDVAGEVIAVGPDSTRFKPGDRVMGCAAGFDTKNNAEKAFQDYVILQEDLSCKIPVAWSWEDAVVLPLGVCTAAAGLFNKDFLGLDLPELGKGKSGKVVVVWGGSSSVGCCAIQLAVAAGYEVVATAGEANWKLVKGLGAKQVFDYNSGSVVEDVDEACQGKVVAGVFDAVGKSAWEPCVEIARKVDGKKMVATTVPGFGEFEGVVVKQMQSLSILNNGVGKAVWEGYLEKALQERSFKSAPQAEVVGKGLENIQKGVDMIGKGVSAKKLVITID